TSLDSTNAAITFVPAEPFPENALIEVFLTDKLRDLSGNLLNNYRGTFRTGSNTGSTLGTKPAVAAIYPTSGQTEVALNPIIEASFNETLNPASITADVVQLRKRSEEHTSELQSRENLVCRLLLE